MDGASLQTRMVAAQITRAGEAELKNLPLPEPGPGEVRIKIEGCGVCASNLGPWAGPEWMDFPLPPGDLGHEAWGHVEATGTGVPPERLGERVAVFGTRGFASHETVREDAALPVPPELGERPIPAEPLGCAVSIFRAARIDTGDTVAIIGIGFLGAVLIRLASRAGARVIAISRREESLELARKMGAGDTVGMDDHHAILGRLDELTGGAGCDIAIECTGYQWPLDLAAETLREEGRLVIAGYHQDGPRQVNMQLWNWKAFDIVNAHVRDRATNLAAMREAMELVKEGVLAPEPLLTHHHPLDNLAEALNETRDKPKGFVKAVVVMP
ncbi:MULTISPECIES: MDR/zinc-dependent alcohol dehydrogenase-like family protein [Actibacterium]|uniref:Threonine dehydrogenase-like Zn-dependent dehydrogenase n=1 Tax=Actibacterium naphthalenivorans TaxID=1614693 RepID=A0A840CCD1_9RHOB|nr:MULTISPECIES: zinc-binding dehydrogenase [Actibacterium]ALG89207.1 L-iditol 2-dehydrogenase [Actibacterium sp. EMB200-NS6]MBB4021208.1 threonine dehydrogenase-like Zn-dependent dehydrogenase [Actibacterium naphthalenivorans]